MRGERTKTLVGLVTSKDALGRPKTLTVIYDEETVDLNDPANREFITFETKATNAAPKLQGKA